MWVVGSNIAIIIRNVHTGHVINGMRSTYGGGTGHIGHVVSVVFHIWVVGSGMVIGLDILDMDM